MVAAFTALLVPGPGPAASHGARIDFETLSHGELLTNQHEAEGIVFDSAQVETVGPDEMLPGTKAVTCTPGIDNVCPAPVTMTFPESVDSMKVIVGYLTDIASMSSRTVSLRAFDAMGKEVASTTRTFTATDSDPKSFVIGSGGSNAIRRAEVVLDGPGALHAVAIDDVHFHHQHPLTSDSVVFSVPYATVAPEALEFGDVARGETSAPLDVTVTNEGEIHVTVTGVSTDGEHEDDFEIVTETCTRRKLVTGAACKVALHFRPGAEGARTGTLVITSFATENPNIVTLSGNGVTARSGRAAQLEPGPFDFGAAPVGTSGATRSISLMNTGKGPVQVAAVRLDPDTGDFEITNDRCSDRQLSPGAACDVAVRLSPRAPDRRLGSLVVPTDASADPFVAELVGTGTVVATGLVQLVPDHLRFETVPVGEHFARRVIVVNGGTAPFTVHGTGMTSAEAVFTVAEDGCSARVVDPGAACSIRVGFAPRPAGSFTGTLAVTSSAAGSPHLVPLAGSGATTPAVPGDGRPPVTLRADPPEAQPGDRLRVSGRGFVGETTLVWSSTQPVWLASLPPEEASTFDLDLSVPDDAPAGPHHVIACDEESRCGEAPIAVQLVGDDGVGAGLLAVALAALVGVALMTVLHARRRATSAALPVGRVPTRDRVRPWAAPPVGRVPPGGRIPPGGRVPPGGGGRPPIPPPRGEREVRTGFAQRDRYEAQLDGREPLQRGREYHFWVELGPSAAGARGAELEVALFTFGGELLVDPGRDVGGVELRPDGSVVVARQAGLHVDARPGDRLLERRLFFPVRTSDRTGRQRLRCSLYHDGALVQSWLITADVRDEPGARTGGGADPQARDRDFVLSRSLHPDLLARMQRHALSVMLNGDADTHELRFFGMGGFKASSLFGAHALEEHLGEARRVLRRLVCGAEEDGAIPGPYRYAGGPDLDRLAADLVDLAIVGFRNYDSMVNRLAAEVPTTGLEEAEERLRALLRGPTRVQVVNKDTAPGAVPAVTFYDRPLDDSATDDKALCPAFVDALRTRAALKDAPCFLGACPTDGDPNVVCPSGFWGFRLYLGMPQSIRNRPDGPLDVPLDGAGGGRDVAVMAVSTDPELRQRPSHQRAVHELASGLEWHFADSRDGAIALLRSLQPRLVYFYCHGGTSRNLTYLSIGAAQDLALTPGNVRTYGMQWKESRPLVFINGCQTTAVGPSTPLNLVAAFVERGWAAGVIGTETTVHEPLACAFAEQVLRRLLVDGATVGESVRDARLALLEAYNPLGLVYVPYVADELRVAPRERVTAGNVPASRAEEGT